VSAPAQVGPSPQGGGPAPSLTEVELTILRYIAVGLTRKQISAEITYSFDGVGRISRRIQRKLGARNLPHAVFVACQLDILDPRRRHGDHAGFAAHKYRGEDPCQACWDGERAYRTERRAARRAAKAAAA